MKKYCILGTDERSVKLREIYKSENIPIASYEFADIVIAPIPFSRDNVKINGEVLECDDLIKDLVNTDKVLFTGAISDVIKEKLEKNNIKYYDLMKLNEVAILNAIPTAEGAIAKAMEITDFTINGSNVLVLGYGRIGKILSKMLSGIGAKTYCEARKAEDIAMIKAMGYNSVKLKDMDLILPYIDIIFNTVPSLLLDEKKLKLLKSSCTIIDLASTPGGVDFITAKKLNLNTVWTLGIPSKVAPYSAASYLKEAIDSLVHKDKNV